MELLLEYLNAPEFLGLMRDISGISDLAKADGHASLYAPGHAASGAIGGVRKAFHFYWCKCVQRFAEAVQHVQGDGVVEMERQRLWRMSDSFCEMLCGRRVIAGLHRGVTLAVSLLSACQIAHRSRSQPLIAYRPRGAKGGT